MATSTHPAPTATAPPPPAPPKKAKPEPKPAPVVHPGILPANLVGSNPGVSSYVVGQKTGNGEVTFKCAAHCATYWLTKDGEVRSAIAECERDFLVIGGQCYLANAQDELEHLKGEFNLAYRKAQAELQASLDAAAPDEAEVDEAQEPEPDAVEG